MDRTGVVLAGGFSTRFEGGDKAVADLAGTPMVRRVVDRLAECVDEVVVNCRPEQTPAIREALAGVDDVVYAEDPEPDRGPMAGIHVGLQAASGEYAAVVACDMPFLDPACLDLLFERAKGEGDHPHDAAVPEMDDGWYQTTQAVYRVDAVREGCARARERGEGKILAALEGLDVVHVPESDIPDVQTFENVNTREELRAAAERLR